MTDSPLCIFRDGQLWIDDAGAYEPVERFRAVLLREHFLQRTREAGETYRPLSARYAAEIQAALTDYEQANKGQEEKA